MVETRDRPRPKESWLQYFRRKGRFSDFILLAWSLIEKNVNLSVANQFNVFFEDKKARILLERTFQRKIDFLKENELISPSEFSVLKTFQEYRNKLFHGKQPHYWLRDEAEKNRIMDNAYEAVQLTQAIGHRSAMPKKLKPQRE